MIYRVWQSLALQWYNECVKTHNLRNEAHHNWYPTRLVDVGLADRSAVKLCITTQDDPSIPYKYMTLSHCWGGLVPYTLTLSNIDILLKGMSLNKLPPTFVEAIKITRRLGVQYLWTIHSV